MEGQESNLLSITEALEDHLITGGNGSPTRVLLFPIEHPLYGDLDELDYFCRYDHLFTSIDEFLRENGITCTQQIWQHGLSEEELAPYKVLADTIGFLESVQGLRLRVILRPSGVIQTWEQYVLRKDGFIESEDETSVHSVTYDRDGTPQLVIPARLYPPGQLGALENPSQNGEVYICYVPQRKIFSVSRIDSSKRRRGPRILLYPEEILSFEIVE